MRCGTPTGKPIEGLEKWQGQALPPPLARHSLPPQKGTLLSTGDVSKQLVEAAHFYGLHLYDDHVKVRGSHASQQQL